MIIIFSGSILIDIVSKFRFSKNIGEIVGHNIIVLTNLIANLSANIATILANG